MLTIADALKMPELATAKVVAGASGLGREIQWVHMVDIPEMADWSRPGELLFTTAFGLVDHPEVQEHLIPSLDERGVCGLVIAVGRYFYQIPEVMIEQANRLEFPILVLPWEVPFIEVTRAITERLINDRYALMQQSLRIHTALTRVVLTGAGLQGLADTLAHLVGRPVVIEDVSCRPLAHSGGGLAAVPPELLAAWRQQGVLEQVRTALHAVRIPPFPDYGFPFEGVMAAIVAGQEHLGYVRAVVQTKPLEDLDMVAVEHAATVAALILVKEREVLQAEQRLQRDLLDELLSLQPGQVSLLAERARRFGYSLSGPHQVLVVAASPTLDQDTLRLTTGVKGLLEADGVQGLAVARGSEVIVLLNAASGETGRALARAICQAGREEGQVLYVGVGSSYPEVELLKASYAEAREALAVVQALHPQDGGHLAFEELGLLYWLRHLPPEVRARNAYHDAVVRLADYDARHGTHLLTTLESYLDAGGRTADVCRRLFIHRNTLRQRLCRIAQVCNMDLTDPLVRLNLHVALKDWRLHPPP